MKRIFILVFLYIMSSILLFGMNDQLGIVPLTVWEKYKSLFIIGFIFFILLLIIVTVLISNIVQKKSILKKLIKREAQLHSISDNLVDGFIYQVDTGIDDSCRKFTYISNNTYQILGVTKDQIYNNAFELYRLLLPEDLVKLQQLEKEAFLNKNILNFNGQIILDNGIKKWFQLTSIPHVSDNGHVLWDGLAVDVCKLKEIENELIIAKEKAEESTKLISSFLTNLSHEIRTPMNGLLGFMDLLRAKEIPSEDKEIYITNYKQSAMRFLNTLDDIVLMSEIEANRTTFNYNQINISFILDQIVSTFQKEANDKGLDLIWNKSNANDHDMIDSDYEKILIILTKLIENSIKFTNSGYIEFGYSKEINHYHFYVKDTGTGIPEHALDSIFKSFTQADMNMNRMHEGIGLGLSITKALVEKLGGRIWSDSIENENTIFHFTIKDHQS